MFYKSSLLFIILILSSILNIFVVIACVLLIVKMQTFIGESFKITYFIYFHCEVTVWVRSPAIKKPKQFLCTPMVKIQNLRKESLIILYLVVIGISIPKIR